MNLKLSFLSLRLFICNFTKQNIEELHEKL